MTFREWLKRIDEVGTGTNSIAVFARPLFSNPVTRPDLQNLIDDKDKKKKKKKQLDNGFTLV